MSWPMPTQPPWGPGMPMAPGMNMPSSYTHDQWAAYQQQNWHQWTQWQQQYAQWHSQYGDKYVPMQGFPGMPGVSLPTGLAQAPPPPDKPPPPPPYDNNQPLYGNNNKPTPVPPPQNSNTKTSIDKQWQANTDTKPPLSGVSEALKKLADEERLFDIQFKKWEDEIDKWRKENVNHPDKQAYKEYEQRFEQCRKQLLERRQQMKLKRDKLLKSGAQPPMPTSASASSSQSNTQHAPAVKYENPQYEDQFNSNNYNKYSKNNCEPQDRYENSNAYNKNNKQNCEPQDRFDSYPNDSSISDSGNFNNQSDTTSFLPTSSSSKGIPGLDLVESTQLKTPKTEVVDITEDDDKNKAPDYSTISKGIKNILGDEKIMNILSMVRDTGGNQRDPSQNPQNFQNYPNMPPNQGGQSYTQDQYYGIQNAQFNMQGNQMQNQYDQNEYSQQDDYYNDNSYNAYSGPNNPPNQRPGLNPDGSLLGPGNPNLRLGPDNRQGLNIRGATPNIRHMGPDSRQAPQGGPNMRPGVFQGGPNMRPSGPNIRQNGPNFRPDGPMRHEGPQHAGPNLRQGAPNMRPSGPNGQSQYNNGPRPLMAAPVARPPLEDISGQQNSNSYYGGHERPQPETVPPVLNQPPRPKWIEEPMFTPSIVVEYEHKALRLKARDFIEPVHTFDYNHISKDSETKKKDFEKEVDQLFTRAPRRPAEREDDERYNRDLFYRDDRRSGRTREPPRGAYRERPRDENRDEYWKDRSRDDRQRDDVYDRHRDLKYDDRRRDDHDRYRRDDYKDRRGREDDYKDRRDRRDDRDMRGRDDREIRGRDDKDIRDDYTKDRSRDTRKENLSRSKSTEKDSRKRALSKELDLSSGSSKKLKEEEVAQANKHIVMIDDLLESPGRDMRPDKIVIILRGPPGSGKSYLAKLIRDREAELGGTVRIMSLDDYFMQEGEVEEKDPITGKIIKKPTLKYEYDASSEETYMLSLKRAFKRSITDGYFPFLIFDAINDQLKSYADIWNFSRQNGFQVYVCTMELDPQVCYKRNIHNRKLEDIEVICSRFFPTPVHHIQLDPTTLLQNAAIQDVQMEDVDNEVVADEPEVESVFTSKWEKMDDAVQLARLDGTNKPLRSSQYSMEDYLQLDEWTPNKAKPGKKTVRWADIEERREQEKMRAIGFVVGQTDWNRMTDPTMGSSALTQTKYIERVKRN